MRLDLGQQFQLTGEDVHVETPSDTGPFSSAPQEKAICVDSSNRDNAASLIPTDIAETTPGCNDALELPNKDDPSIITDTKVKGVQIGTHEIKVINFADDTTIS